MFERNNGTQLDDYGSRKPLSGTVRWTDSDVECVQIALPSKTAVFENTTTPSTVGKSKGRARMPNSRLLLCRAPKLGRITAVYPAVAL